MQSAQPTGKQRIAVALSQLTTKEAPSGAQLRLMFLEKKGLDVLLDMLQVGGWLGVGGRVWLGGRAAGWQDGRGGEGYHRAPAPALAEWPDAAMPTWFRPSPRQPSLPARPSLLPAGPQPA